MHHQRYFLGLQALFLDLKAGHVDNMLDWASGSSAFIYQRIILLDYFSRNFDDYIANCIFSKLIIYIFLSQ